MLTYIALLTTRFYVFPRIYSRCWICLVMTILYVLSYIYVLLIRNISVQNLSFKTGKCNSNCHRRDYNEWIWFWRYEEIMRKLHDEILNNSSNIMCVLLHYVSQRKKKEGERSKWTFTECSLYSFFIVHESRPELARKSNRKLLYSSVLSQFSSYISFSLRCPPSVFPEQISRGL